GVILGPRAEAQLRKSLQLSSGDPAGLFSEPVAVVAYVIIALVLLWPLIAKLLRRLFPKAAAGIEELAESVPEEAETQSALTDSTEAGSTDADSAKDHEVHHGAHRGDRPRT
ncbi:MAG: tripartite tricarboxylate transporter permease, partial [Paeniglutamicibacter terrestris]